jgi:hypothetical protein
MPSFPQEPAADLGGAAAEGVTMSLWSNDGKVDEGAKVGLRIVLRRVGRNGGPEVPIDPAPLEAALRAFVGAAHEEDEPDCWVSDDGVYWHAEVYWREGITVSWDPADFPSPDALARDLAAFAAWAQTVAAWLRSKPVAGLPRTTAWVRAQYGKIWMVRLDGGG